MEVDTGRCKALLPVRSLARISLVLWGLTSKARANYSFIHSFILPSPSAHIWLSKGGRRKEEEAALALCPPRVVNEREQKADR